MQPWGILMPGAFRLRALQPLSEDDASCRLVYDVERAAVFEVPEELRFHVARALDSGDLDEEILAWLVSEDLWTAERRGDWAGAGLMGGNTGHERGGAWTWDGGGRGQAGGGLAGEEVHGWIGREPLTPALGELNLIFMQAYGHPKLVLHLDWAGRLPAGGLLEELVAEARRQAAATCQQVRIELVLDPSQVTVEAAARVAAQAVHVRLRCAMPAMPALPPEVEAAVSMLTGAREPRLGARGVTPSPAPPTQQAPQTSPVPLAAEPPRDLNALTASSGRSAAAAPGAPCRRLTVQCRLAGAVRLIEIWRWAQASGVQCLDVRQDEDAMDEERIREYRQDLMTICEETCRDLEAGRRPVELQALTRIARRLARHAETTSDSGALLDDEAIPCLSCWARTMCSHSALVAAPADGEERRGPSPERCTVWTAEAEVAVRLHHRLSQIDLLRWPSILSFIDGETEVRPLSLFAVPSMLSLPPVSPMLPNISPLLTLASFSYADLLAVKPS
jgi:hypothetical protein